MPGSRNRVIVAVAVCALLLLAVTGCVRAKPERHREPLPTLPAVASGGTSGLVDIETLNTPASSEVGVSSLPEEGPTLEPTLVPTPAPTPVPTPTPYAGPWYTVMPGDTLSTIAAAHGSTVEAFTAANEGVGAVLRVGQQLKLPEGVAPLWESDPEQTTIHVVRYGETLNDIAARYRMPAGQIMTLNPSLRDPSLLQPGQELVVAVQPIGPNDIVHVVAAGDSLANIAAYYGVDMDELARYNYITDPNRLFVGQEVVIPR
ncbi:MAG: LysM peptidoglycan-binding domain-containing protein [Anaerolineae bacterium]|jgi:LysM repeat protein|nr:LysM peptidoglycan-binding domain-containing protein [Chloroflexota bacterium]